MSLAARADDPGEYVFWVDSLDRAIDGDTVDLTLTKLYRLPFHLVERKAWSMRFRIAAVDAVELRTEHGPAARDFTAAWINARIDCLVAETFKPSGPLPDGQFGRYLAALSTVDGETLADAIRQTGYEKLKG